jgi:hypothetical protein
MAEEQPVEVLEEQPTTGPSPNVDPYLWVADEPRTTRSRFSGYPRSPVFVWFSRFVPGFLAE